MHHEDRQTFITWGICVALIVVIIGSSASGERILRITEVIAILATGGIVWWYTCETQSLRKTAEAQLLAAHEPLLILSQRVSQEGVVEVKNIGPGVAFKVTCHLIPAPMPDGGVDPAVNSAPYILGSLPPQESFPWPTYHGLSPQDKTWHESSDILGIMQILFASLIPVEVRYQDARGRAFVTIATLGNQLHYVGLESESGEARAFIQVTMPRDRVTMV